MIMFSVFSIKQEPELDITSDNECDQQLNILGDSRGIDTSHISVSINGEDSKNVLQNNESLNSENSQDVSPTIIENQVPHTIINGSTNCDKKNVRSFQCYMCSKSYTAKQMLKLHIHSIHMLLKPFQCEICSRSFADKYTLTTHARIHSGERPYKCTTCLKTFVQHSALTKHKRIHTKEKPFKCEICLKSFSDRSSLIPHRKIHTGELIWNRSFKCDICRTSFVKNSHLVRHNKSKSHLKEVMRNGDVSNIKLEEQ